MKKEIRLEFIGWSVKGYAKINHWGNGQQIVPMDEAKIMDQPLTKACLLGTVNDGGFGCRSIESAEIEVYEIYQGDVELFRTRICADNRYSHLFLGWRNFNYL